MVISIIAVIFVNFTWFVIIDGGKIGDFHLRNFQFFAIIIGVTFIIGFAANIRFPGSGERGALCRYETQRREL